MQKGREQHIIRGQVQGVGFRPFVYRIAAENNLTGFVRNTPLGVQIEVQGLISDLQAFNRDFSEKLPPLAKIFSHEQKQTELLDGETEFQIIHTEQGGHTGHSVMVSPDVAICSECRQDILDKKNRRHAYAFTNCTSCGPRYTITKSIPYDRPVTTMACFPLCEKCTEEYISPLDRRFHAQPNACAECGPVLWLTDGKQGSGGEGDVPKNQNILAQDTKALLETVKLLNQGKIVAVKGLGGFQLACDAYNEQAVEELRRRKNRPDKAFAVMVKDIEAAREIAYVSEEAEKLLTSVSAPIVLCRAKENCLPAGIAPDTRRIGIMLAYTPLHLLLFSPDVLEENTVLTAPKALVMTSANEGGKPICIKNRQALHDLADIADYYLFHNRDILIRVDDSVCLVLENARENGLPQAVYFRRARGYVPSPVIFPKNISYLQSVYATGTFLKNTFAFTKSGEAYQSQHIGDLDNLEVLDFYDETSNHLQKLLEVTPQKVLTDYHPDFPSTHIAEAFSLENNVPLEKVQHHIAHAYSVLAEQEEISDSPYLAVVLDGTGLGLDRTVWGGEVFYVYAKEKRWYRLARLSPVALIGGDKASYEPWRIALAYHRKAQEKGYLCEEDVFSYAENAEYARQVEQCLLMLEKNINCPQSSGCGRLFDAVSALCGICSKTSYEGQAAIRLENYAFMSDCKDIAEIPCHVSREILEKRLTEIQTKSESTDYVPVLEMDTVYLYAQLYKMLAAGKSKEDIAVIFHNSLAAGLIRCLDLLAADFPSENLILSGGVFNNEILVRKLFAALKEKYRILFPSQTPVGDAGISLGQAFYGAMADF